MTINKAGMQPWVKRNIKIDVGKCTECCCCQLICSLTYEGSFNLEKARIIIDPPKEISFFRECIENCSLCTKYCVYGAITKSREQDG